MKKEWKAPEMTCLAVVETYGEGMGYWSDDGWAQSWGENAVAMVSGEPSMTGDLLG